MQHLFTRTLERRGLYVGSLSQRWNGALGPAPTAYFALRLGPQPEGSQMVRFEAGFRGRVVWMDWGRERH